MTEQAKVVAVLVANPALSSILTMVLAAVPSLRVRPFESQSALRTYMRLAPVDLVVSDFDSERARADHVARDLHGDTSLERRAFQIIALTSKVTAEIKLASISAGIDEIIVKPMSPKYLLERVLFRLQSRASAHPLRLVEVATRPPRLGLGSGSNVIPLFGRHLEPTH